MKRFYLFPLVGAICLGFLITCGEGNAQEKPQEQKASQPKESVKKEKKPTKPAEKKPAEKKSPDQASKNQPEMYPFGKEFDMLETDATGEWWKPKGPKGGQKPRLLVPREEVLAFAVYAHAHGVLKLTAQLYPLQPEEPRTVRLEFKKEGKWEQVAEEKIHDLGWSAHFRIEDWDNTKNVPYRLSYGAETKSTFEGLIRKDPIDKDEIVIGSMSCNSRRTPGSRKSIVDNLIEQDPDMLFFAGDQSYHHTEHTFGWLEFGVQFREVMKDRPTITIPDDHDVGQANLWGEYGKKAQTPAGPAGGYYYPAKYVNMVERCQTWHLPDAYDSTPIKRGIGVYYTSINIGGIDFAIVEDRKFKSGPEGKIPQMGPRPDHINDPSYDRSSVDVEGLKLLGDRQLKFLHKWGQDWTGADMKAVLSQTAFCGAVHLHGQEDNRLLADLDCNGWPQTGRNKALQEIRRVWGTHICGDQHLAVVVKHGIEEAGDGPFAFTSPAIVNTIYGRWWHPLDEQPGPNAVEGSPLAWTGDFLDGLGNHIRMIAYANPEDRKNEKLRGDGYGIVRFNKKTREITFECWPRFNDVNDGDVAQYPGWPVTFSMDQNDSRDPVGWLPVLQIEGTDRPVIQVIHDQSKEILYTVRAERSTFRAPVYYEGTYTVKVGYDKPNGKTLKGLEPLGINEAGMEKVVLPAK
ncbi:Phosphodiesterase/alkaline phosphatase D [Planctomycetales bacterium 10988]|nr:Phosphodiesterase/alkaline phosphatase D [Planctomycetales bacterium 10988]